MSYYFNQQKLTNIISSFIPVSPETGITPLTSGHINDTYHISDFILQRLNPVALPSVEYMMSNIIKVTEHLQKKGFEYRTLHFYKVYAGSSYLYYDSDGSAWRLCDYIDSVSYGKTFDTDIVFETGKAFGAFERALTDFDISDLFSTLPGFHNTPVYFDRLKQEFDGTTDTAAHDSVTADRITSLYIKLMHLRDKACILSELLSSGRLTLRVTHNDTKINNLLFDKDLKKAIAVIDLDTVMPGLIAWDFGDGVRFAAGIEQDGHMIFDFEIFKAFCDGFIPQVKDFLTAEEKETMYLAPLSMAVELAVRYLTDFLSGSVYFHTDYPEQNLDKAEKQYELALLILEKEEDIREYLNSLS